MSIFKLFNKKIVQFGASALTISALLIQPASAQVHNTKIQNTIIQNTIIHGAKNQPAAAKNIAQVLVIDGIDFGDDTSQWANDGECDDPRFIGGGTAVDMEDVDLGHDATDCSTLYQAGAVTLMPEPGDIVDSIDFGDNTSQWSNDGECDDPRFGGEGVDDMLLDEDMAHDANDCKSLFLAGTVQYLGDDPNMELVVFDGIDFGDNTSQWNSDGECDDPRFSGTGMAQQLVDADLAHDAQDCLALYKDGSITLNRDSQPAPQTGAIDFGDDSSQWSNDGECDDPRFAGEGVAGLLLEADLGHDATDCSSLLEAGKIYLAGNGGEVPAPGQIDFGDDSSQWSNDGECDDPRFSGAGVADTLLDIDLGHDASDCRALFQAGTIQLAGNSSSVAQDLGHSNFGDDSSQWSNDGECDDPRFIGEGMAVQLITQDIARDATDCQTLFDAGNIAFIDASNVDFGDDESRWPNDGECDDPRFSGEGSAVKLDPLGFGHDATDCKALLASGAVEFVGGYLTILASDNTTAMDVTPATQIDTSIDWGDNTSQWANDGECDDPRFSGEGVADILLDEDKGHDANDCQALFDAGQIEFNAASNISNFHNSGFDFGDNTSEYANNKICDDPRFGGSGVDPILLPEDEGHDAADCKALFRAGQISLLTDLMISFGDDNFANANDGRCDDARFAGKAMAQTLLDAGIRHDASDCQAAFARGKIYFGEDGRIDFGDNSSEWADDNECDDPRFSGPGSASSPSDDNLMKDAADCRTLYRTGEIFLLPREGSVFPINFGDDNNQWANDGECDDPRFSGAGMAAELLDEDMGHDAADCEMLLNIGQIQFGSDPIFEAKLKGSNNSDTSFFDYGDDSSQWSNDGECDDPRFAGNGMASVLLDEDIAHDATDCQTLVEAGQISVIAGGPSDIGGVSSGQATFDIDFGDNSSFFANDGECDDDRFTGSGMAQPPLTEEHRGHDANDCQAAANEGTIALLLGNMGSLPINDGQMDSVDPSISVSHAGIVFGDNMSIFARDNECDDPRFSGPGTVAGSSDDHMSHDADDCLAAYNAGATFNDTAPMEAPTPDNNGRISHSGIDFGDDNGDWANDGVCDDPRFSGPGVADLLLPADEAHDASDCSKLFLEGQVQITDLNSPDGTTGANLEVNPTNNAANLDFGDNNSLFADDNECDDDRFTGAGMAPAPLFEGHRGHDAADCQALFDDGEITLAP